MNVNFEIMSDDLLENVIACMNYKIDRVIVFSLKKSDEIVLKNFLLKYCGVKEVCFYFFEENDIEVCVEKIHNIISNEMIVNNKCFFDLTGSNNILSMIFGMLSNKLDIPIYTYDIINNNVINLNKIAKDQLQNIKKENIKPFTINMLIELRGGKINFNLQKNTKKKNCVSFFEDIDCIYEIAKENYKYWNLFSNFLGFLFKNEEKLIVNKSKNVIFQSFDLINIDKKMLSIFNSILEQLSEKKIIYKIDDFIDGYNFSIKNLFIKDCLLEGGCILELHTYIEEIKKGKECMIGAHIDWDGIIHKKNGIDVINEIDVISLDKNVLTFISCKTGKLGSQQSLHSLYELETVAKRFGGKYVKKVLVSFQEMGNVYKNRAKEMKIELRCK